MFKQIITVFMLKLCDDSGFIENKEEGCGIEMLKQPMILLSRI